jgi:hypothetical protein
MLWLIQNILFSISLIIVIHYLYIYFETTLTSPKVKDLIHCPKQKYKSLFDTINKNLDNEYIHKLDDGKDVANRRTTEPSLSSNLGIDESKARGDNNRVKSTSNEMKTDLKAFLHSIGLKAKSSADQAFLPSYETS